MISKANFWGMFYAFTLFFVAVIYTACMPTKKVSTGYLLVYSNCLAPVDSIEFVNLPDASMFANSRLKDDIYYECPASYRIYKGEKIILKSSVLK